MQIKLQMRGRQEEIAWSSQSGRRYFLIKMKQPAHSPICISIRPKATSLSVAGLLWTPSNRRLTNSRSLLTARKLQWLSCLTTLETSNGTMPSAQLKIQRRRIWVRRPAESLRVSTLCSLYSMINWTQSYLYWSKHTKKVECNGLESFRESLITLMVSHRLSKTTTHQAQQ